MSRRERGEVNLDAVVMLCAVAIMAVLVLLARSSSDDPHGGSPPPDDQAAIGQHVRVELTARGDLAVTHRVNTATAVDALQLSVAQDFGASNAPEIEAVEISSGGDVLAQLATVSDHVQRIELDRAVREITLTYHVVATLSSEDETVAGRMLARVPALNVDYDDEAGPMYRLLTAPGRILNVACVTSGGAPPRPCGAADDEGWSVALGGRNRDDSLVMQVQLD